MVLKRCEKCGVMVKNLSKHKRRNRCEPVEDRRLFRKEIKARGGGSAAIGIVSVLGARGTRSATRLGKAKAKKTRGKTNG